MRFPVFKGRRSGLSVRFSTGAFGLADSGRRHVQLPRIGLVRTHESTRKLARRIQAGTARIRSVTVSMRRGRWHASFSVEVERAEETPARSSDTVGVDVGISHLAVLSTGETVDNPRPLEQAQGQLRRLGRQAARRTGPDKRTGRQPSARWRKTQAKISRVHARAANLREDGLHRLTTRLSARYGTIVVEDALGFVTAHPGVTSAIIGPRTLEHLHSQLAAADTVLSADVLDAIDAIVAPGADLAPEEKLDTPPSLLDPALRRR
jgi:putative transposase